MNKVPEIEGRQAFGVNVQAYDDSRPDYPSWMFDLLVREDVICPSSSALEVGAGNGLATRKLIERGITRLTMVEPDQRFAPFLEDLRSKAGTESQLIHEPFEDAGLPGGSFDVVLIATAFHWLDPKTRAQKLSDLIRKDGCVVLMWNVFQDLNLDDAFHEATADMLAQLASSPSGKPDSLPFALDRVARDAEFLSTGCFETRLYAEGHWKLDLNPKEVRSLYGGFSQISRLPEEEKEALLDRLEQVATSEFDGTVVRNMTSPLYVFQKTK